MRNGCGVSNEHVVKSKAEEIAETLKTVRDEHILTACGGKPLTAKGHWLFSDGSIIHARTRNDDTRDCDLLAARAGGARYRVLIAPWSSEDATVRALAKCDQVMAWGTTKRGVLDVMVAGDGAELLALAALRSDVIQTVEPEPVDFSLWSESAGATIN